MITTEDVTKFAKAARKCNVWEKVKNKYRGIILTGLLAGETIPLDGPYTVDLSQNGGKDWSWELAYEKLLAKTLREKHEYTVKESRILAREEMAKMVEEAPDKEVVRINGVAYIGGVRLTPKVNSREEKKAEAAA